MEEITKLAKLFFILLAFTFAAQQIQVSETEARVLLESSQPQRDQRIKGGNEAWRMMKSWRPMIGSTAPTCTYNECKGCKYKCRAEQVPVEGNDPINSPYHYRCVCHR
ncbi:EPIDERMAL PATTERNING FACTOR-like protein 9 [Vigna unguiculata]|uniref:EPIDERMAL PATTERNING FACTOR-like protein 9 n=1 Tax=Vigna unguiculata TaxID=3917 RepID=UPI001016D0E2|nr:EPIDERMAL PATTERNING FACTOR-like protein 9 [Vigna unguiculata]